MKGIDLDRLTACLREELERLDAEVAEADAEDRESLSDASGENAHRDHMADQGSATFERELDMTFEQNLRTRQAEVKAALERVVKGTYGKCERCGGDIPVERMEAATTASLCIVCKSADECR